MIEIIISDNYRFGNCERLAPERKVTDRCLDKHLALITDNFRFGNYELFAKGLQHVKELNCCSAKGARQPSKLALLTSCFQKMISTF
jgi:hypothetical protein